VTEAIRLTGYLSGEDRAATAEIKVLSDVHRAKARRPPNARPRILIGGSYSYGAKLSRRYCPYARRHQRRCGGRLKGTTANSEQIVRWNPEWIVAERTRVKPSRCLPA
jgi:hypothetical protein